MSKIIVKDLAGPASSSNKIYIASGSELDIANSSGTINLAVDAGDIASGTLANARLSAGHVLQAVTATLTTAESWASGTGGWQAIGTSGCEVTITPSSTDSKILIIYSCGGLNSNNGSTPATRILRAISGGASTNPLVATGVGSRLAAQTLSPGYIGGDLGSGEAGFDTGSHFLDSPNSTAAITYSIQWGGRTDGALFTNYIGRTVTDTNGNYTARAVTVITAMEIKG